ncbi:MAG: YkgJ family cysteine cluster protein [Nitrosopumilaceae archaeon]
MENDKFSITTLCSSCKKITCCTNFFPPLAYPSDLDKLKHMGKSEGDFLKNVIIKGKTVKTIKKKDNSTTCMFWDEENRLCSIYENRPFDCKMFPFDVFWTDNEYHWIVYSCNPDSDWTWCEEYLQKLEADPQFSEMMKNNETIRLTSESVESLADIEEPPYAILRKVNWKA